MDPEHKSILKTNRVKLIEGIADPISVSDVLFSNGVFTDSLKQEVEAEKTPNGKVRKILDIVPKRGQHAFDKFYQALLVTNNTHVADLLKPELAGTQATYLPAVWPSEEDMNQPVQVKPCDVRSHIVTTQWQSAGPVFINVYFRLKSRILSLKLKSEFMLNILYSSKNLSLRLKVEFKFYTHF